MCTLLYGGHYGAGEGEFLLQLWSEKAALRNAVCGMRERSTEFGQYGDALFENRYFIDRERRTGCNVSPDEGGQIPRGSHAARLCPPIEGDSVAWPEPYRDSISRRRVLRLRRFGTRWRAVNFQKHPNCHQCQRRF